MASRRVPVGGTVDADAVSLEGRFLELARRISRLERAANQPPIISSTFTAELGQFLRIQAPPEGIRVLLPEAQASNRGQRVTFNLETDFDVNIQALDGNVNGQEAVVVSSLGVFDAVSDGESGWSVPSRFTDPNTEGDLNLFAFKDDFSSLVYIAGSTVALSDTTWITGGVGTPVIAFSQSSGLDDSEHAGIAFVGTSANANDTAFMCKGNVSTANLFQADLFDRVVMVFRLSSVSSVSFQLGVTENVADFALSSSLDYAVINFDTAVDGNFHFYTDNSSGTPEDTDTGVAAAATTWYVAEIRRLSTGAWRLTLDGVVVAEHSTSAIPTDEELNFGMGTLTRASAVKSLRVDLVDLRCKPFVDRT